MKKLLLYICILMIIMFSAACGVVKSEPEPVDLGAVNQTLFVVSDNHLLADSLITGSTYDKKALVNDGRMQHYDYRLLEGLVAETNRERPDFLILTGDLTLNGEMASHGEVIRILNEVNDATQVLVIPGNHDCYNQYAYDYSNNFTADTAGVNYDDFKRMYADFGYSGALYYDDYSLSYIYELAADRWALMLDTNLSEYNQEEGMNAIGGYLDDETLEWMKDKLSIAKAKGIEVVSFTHHSLITHDPNFEKFYTLRNADEVLTIFKEYDVKLNFSGHLHIQNIQQADGFTDIASVGLLDYGNRYGRVSFCEKGIDYEAVRVTLEDEDLETASFNHFTDTYFSKTMKNSREKYGKKAEDIIKFVSEINAYYFDGDYVQIHNLMKNNKSFVKYIKKNIDNNYIRQILTVENKDQRRLQLIYSR